jgi:hypothetical protein
VKSEPVLPERPVFISSLLQQLGSLQAQVLTLQHQLTLLTNQWSLSQPGPVPDSPMVSGQSLPSSQEKSLASSQDKSLASPEEKSLASSQEKSLASPEEKSLASSQEKSLASPEEKSLASSQEKESRSAKVAPPLVDRRKRPCVLPLVEYGTGGKCVVITPEQGLLDFEPDSPEWFAWLSRLSSFRFVGQHGHFTAHRDAQCKPTVSWRATRTIRSRSHSLHLTRTEFLTLAVLEQAAASLQSHLN